MVHDKSTYFAWRRRFQPSPIELIIVAESPPVGGRYFYNPDGDTNEPLFAAMMKQLKASPASKVEGLRKFQAAGLMLVDATYTPVNKSYDGAQRKKVILESYPLLVADLRELMTDRPVPVIVIKTPLCDLLNQRLVTDGFRVLNGDIRPPFPSHGNQPKFHVLFAEILRSAGIAK